MQVFSVNWFPILILYWRMTFLSSLFFFVDSTLVRTILLCEIGIAEERENEC